MFDVILRGGRVLDGTGAPDKRADVAVSGDKIVAVGMLGSAEARDVVDVSGHVVCPGFIDAHCHSDGLPFAEDPLPAKILQGVTTEVNGNCGTTPFPLVERTADLLKEQHSGLLGHLPWDWANMGDYADSLERAGPVSNIVQLVGHGALRVAAMGFDNREPTADEMATMKRLLEQALAEGAAGLSSGLVYVPGVYSDTDELIELARVMRGTGRLYTSHIRGETDTLFESVAEALAIGEANGLPVQVSHLKAAGRSNHGRAGDLLGALEHARDRGIDVNADAYPYNAGSTRLAALLPPWVQEGGREAMLGRIADPGTQMRIADDFETGLPGWENFAEAAGWENVRIASCERHPEWLGQNMAQIADDLRMLPVAALFHVLREEDAKPTVVMTMMDDDDVRSILSHDLVMIGSDAIIARGKPHPRTWGTYPRALGYYARGEGLFSIADVVRKMTSYPAQKFNLHDRGIVRPGMAADLVVFDPATVVDRATAGDPEQSPVGMPHVMVNGGFAVRDGDYAGARLGRVLRAG
jgi:N-acyl-D-aspartate/D-glutamate deacylase